MVTFIITFNTFGCLHEFNQTLMGFVCIWYEFYAFIRRNTSKESSFWPQTKHEKRIEKYVSSSIWLKEYWQKSSTLPNE